MSAKWDRSWIRIGRYDKPRRRSLWARILPFPGPSTPDQILWDMGRPLTLITVDNDPEGPMYHEDEIEALELCSGREGDDDFVRIERSNPAFSGLLCVIERAIANVDEPPDPDESHDR